MTTEIQIYLAKFLPDPRRNEPRNIGLVIRNASDEIYSRFVLEGEQTEAIPKQLEIHELSKVVDEWRGAIDKYNVKALQWIGKRKSAGQKFYLEFMGGELVQEYDPDKLYEELVL
jgi:hypothetical protein